MVSAIASVLPSARDPMLVAVWWLIGRCQADERRQMMRSRPGPVPKDWKLRGVCGTAAAHPVCGYRALREEQFWL
jgi:hypothetical protein